MKTTISVIITDQGCGGSYCGNCGCEIILSLSKDMPKNCPECNFEFTKIDKPYINLGGSDF